MAARNTSPRRVLWVEGKDDSAVVQSLCKQHQVPHSFKVEDSEGDANLLQGLPVQLRRQELECFGVVLDADADSHARWTSVRNVLLTEGYTGVPDAVTPEGTILSAAPDLPRFGAWIMPDNASPGMLEDFVGALVPADDFLWSHAAEVIDAIPEEHRHFGATERSKAQIHTWLAWQKGPGSPMGQAIGKGDLDATAPDAQRFVGWLRRLFVEDVPLS